MNTDFNYLAEILMTKLYPQIYLPLRENSFSYSLKTVFHWFSLLTPAYIVRWEGNVLTLSVYLSTWRGGPRSQIFGPHHYHIITGGEGWEYHIIFTSLWGGTTSLPHHYWGDNTSLSHHYRGGYLVSVKGKFFDTRFGFIHVQMGKKSFSPRDPPSKGKFFWHQIWLNTCSDGKKNFFPRDPPPVKGKFFDTRFGFIHVQMGKIFFSEGTPYQ